MQDVTGKTLSLGDYVVYPGRVGNSMRTEMVLGRIIAFKLRNRFSIAKGHSEHEVATVKQINRAVTGKPNWYSTANVSIQNVHNLTKVDYTPEVKA